MVLAAHFERKINYCTDLEKSVLVNNFEKRHWTAVNAEDDWNFFWAGMNTCRSIFSVDNGYRMNDNQYAIFHILTQFTVISATSSTHKFL